MELRLPSPTQLAAIYARDLLPAFPVSELKPLSNMQELWQRGLYRPLCLFDGEEIIGEAFLFDGEPGWALFDYLCVTESRRNDGLGSVIIDLLQKQFPDTVLFGEAEDIDDAPDPAMARRRLGFYLRNGAKQAAYDTNIFGAHYKTLYWAKEPIPDKALMRQHGLIYRQGMPEEIFDRFVQIPLIPGKPMPQMPWMT